MSPVRLAAPAFALTLKVTVPGPCPLAPPAITIHASPAVAVQPQALDVETETVPDPPALPNVVGDADNEYEHAPGASCEIKCGCPPTAIEPLRDCAEVLGAIEYLIDPVPVPVPPVRIEIH